MAQLSETYRQILSTLSEEERQKYWATHADDIETKTACENAGVEWDPETESAAIRYLRNVLKRRSLARNPLSEHRSDVASACVVASSMPNLTLNIPQDEQQGADLSSKITKSRSTSSSAGSESDVSDVSLEDYLTKKDAERQVDLVDYSYTISGDEDSDSDDNNATDEDKKYDFETADDEEDSDCESKTSKASNKKKVNEVPAETPSVQAIVIKKYPKSAFCEVSKVDKGGLFNQVCFGYIRGRPVKVKSFHGPMNGIDSNSREIEALKKIFQLDHRNLIPVLGMIDVGLRDCPQLVYATEEKEVNLLQYLRDTDKTSPKGYATFGKFSLDIINACEYLHKHRIVHGNLSACSVTVRKASRVYGGSNERKIHVNSFLSDYGVIQLTKPELKKNFFKATNGKNVQLRWVPKELLERNPSCAVNDPSYTFESDVWAFGVVLWEMWTNGDVPYGKNKTNLKVEQDILKDCHPLTFKKPSSCPQHILDVMEGIFAPAHERPTFSELKEKFDGFRKFKYERKEKEKEVAPTPKMNKAPHRPYHSTQNLHMEDEKHTSTSKEAQSPAYLRYSRVRQWQDQSNPGKHTQARGPYRGGSVDARFPGNRMNNGGGRTFTNTNYNKPNENKGKPKVAVVCVPVMHSGGGSGLLSGMGIGDFQSQINLAQAFAALSAATRQNTGSVGMNNVNVNIENQRVSRELDGARTQNVQGQAQHQNPRMNQKRTYKKRNYNGKKKGGAGA